MESSAAASTPVAASGPAAATSAAAAPGPSNFDLSMALQALDPVTMAAVSSMSDPASMEAMLQALASNPQLAASFTGGSGGPGPMSSPAMSSPSGGAGTPGDKPLSASQKYRKEQKPLVADGPNGRWTDEEHEAFLRGLETHGHDWKMLAREFIRTRTAIQVRSHAQKYFQQMKKRAEKEGMRALPAWHYGDSVDPATGRVIDAPAHGGRKSTGGAGGSSGGASGSSASALLGAGGGLTGLEGLDPSVLMSLGAGVGLDAAQLNTFLAAVGNSSMAMTPETAQLMSMLFVGMPGASLPGAASSSTAASAAPGSGVKVVLEGEEEAAGADEAEGAAEGSGSGGAGTKRTAEAAGLDAAAADGAEEDGQGSAKKARTQR